VSNRNEQRKREINAVRPATLKNWRSFSYTTISMKDSCFDWSVAL
jgi:hypothetical protein